MPNVDKQTRDAYDPIIAPLGAELAVEPAPEGVVNYVITCLIREWLGSKPRYTDFNAAIGVLECAKLELYRRAVAAYEDEKIKENGDVY